MYIKTLILVGLGFLLGYAPLNAQWSVGALLGLNIASVSVDPEPSSEDYSSRARFAVGGVVDYELNDNMAVRAMPMIMGKGATIEENGEKAAFKLGYLEIPIVFMYLFDLSSSDLRPYAMAGPSMGFSTSANVKFDGSDNIDIKDEVAGFDFGILFGAGAQYPIDPVTAFIDLRYTLGLSNLNDVEGESTVKNRGFMIAVGATVPLNE